jgi:hypothetical protein
VRRTTDDHRDWARTAAELHRLGVRPPCLLTGHLSIPVAYYTGCSSAAPRGHNANSTVAEILRTSRRIPVAALTRPDGPPPAYARDWQTLPAAGMDIHRAPTTDRDG